MGSAFWLPALLEMPYVYATPSLTGGFFDFRNHFLDAVQLFQRKWGYGPSRPGPDEIGFMYGEAMWLGAAAALAALALPPVRRRLEAARLAFFLVGGALTCLFMTLPYSLPLWPRLPLLPFVQFPWRFLLPATAFGAAGLAFAPRLAPEKWRLPIGVVLALAAALASAQFFHARYLFHDVQRNSFVFAEPELAGQATHDPDLKRPDQFLTIAVIRRLGVNTTASHDYLPIFCRRLPEREPENAAEPGDDQVKVLWSRWGYPPAVTAEAVAAVQQDVVLNQFFFPGWEALVDGEPAPVKVQPETGRMIVTIGPGRHLIQARFADTLPRIAGELIGAASLLALLLWAWFVLRHERE
jgi:hypothetical protein